MERGPILSKGWFARCLLVVVFAFGAGRLMMLVICAWTGRVFVFVFVSLPWWICVHLFKGFGSWVSLSAVQLYVLWSLGRPSATWRFGRDGGRKARRKARVSNDFSPFCGPMKCQVNLPDECYGSASEGG